MGAPLPAQAASARTVCALPAGVSMNGQAWIRMDKKDKVPIHSD